MTLRSDNPRKVEQDAALGAAATTDAHLPLLSLGPIRNIANETDADIALRFLGDYLQMLPHRLQRIMQGLHQGDIEASMDAILSLRIASAMAGALDIETYCRRIEALIRAKQFDLAIAQAKPLIESVLYIHTSRQTILDNAKEGLLHKQH